MLLRRIFNDYDMMLLRPVIKRLTDLLFTEGNRVFPDKGQFLPVDLRLNVPWSTLNNGSFSALVVSCGLLRFP